MKNEFLIYLITDDQTYADLVIYSIKAGEVVLVINLTPDEYSQAKYLGFPRSL